MIETPRRSARILRRTTLIAALATVALLTVYARTDRPSDRLWGDEPTYLAMATSMARDGDMKYDAADRAWVLERKPGALILQRFDSDRGGELGYSKPIVYPLLAAPFVKLFGERGMLLANAALLLGALLLAWNHLHRFGDRIGAQATWLAFLAASPVLPYLFWRMGETAQFSLALGGLVLVCRDLRFPLGEAPGDRADWRPIALGGALLGLLVALRLPNVIVAAAPVAAWAATRRWRPFAVLAGSIVLSLALCTVATDQLTGSPNPYRAVRTSFDERTGYPTTEDAAIVEEKEEEEEEEEEVKEEEESERQQQDSANDPASGGVRAVDLSGGSDTGDGRAEAANRFDTDPATHRPYWALLPDLTRSIYALLYAFVGRHTGLLIYFPALFALVPALRPGDRVTACLGLAAVGLLGFYLLWLPGNFFGGSTFVGNRYWLAGYPLLLVALRRLPSTRSLFVVWILSAIVGVSALVGLLETDRAGRVDSQAHTRGPLFRQLPAESSAAAIDGWQARRWSGDVLRFTDPYAEVREQGFFLPAGGKAANVLVAMTSEGRPLRLAARAEGAGVLEIRDWRHRQSVLLEPGQTALVPLEPSRPWRHHPTIPGPSRDVFGLEMRFVGSGSGAEVRYLGAGEEPITAYRLRRATLPESGFAGSSADAWVGVQNRSSWTWATAGVIPTYLRYRLEPTDGGEPTLGPRLALASPTPPQGTLRMPFEIDWPETPGTYELSVDLEQEFLGPLADRVGRPIVERTVAVGPRQE